MYIYVYIYISISICTYIKFKEPINPEGLGQTRHSNTGGDDHPYPCFPVVSNAFSFGSSLSFSGRKGNTEKCRETLGTGREKFRRGRQGLPRKKGSLRQNLPQIFQTLLAKKRACIMSRVLYTGLKEDSLVELKLSAHCRTGGPRFGFGIQVRVASGVDFGSRACWGTFSKMGSL